MNRAGSPIDTRFGAGLLSRYKERGMARVERRRALRLKFLAISDTHLGEKTSLLSYTQGQRHVANVIQDHLGDGGRVEVDTLLLMGDIPERSHATPPVMLESTHAFMETLGEAISFEKAVYMPGNHDHVLWTGYCKGRCGEDASYCITAPEGDPIVRRGVRVSEDDGADELLSIVFEHPSGVVWRGISGGRKDITFANPLYAERFGGRTYVFTHGTHFRKEVASPLWIKKIGALLTANGFLGDLEIKAEGDVREAKDILDLERIVAPFIDGMLPPSDDNPAADLDRAGYLLAVLSARFGLKRQSPDESRLFSRDELPGVPQERIPHHTPEGEVEDIPLRLFRKYFLPHMLAHLEDHGLPTRDITFVFGDTHDGGWGEWETDGGGTLRAYNTGGWVTYDLEDHPTCYLFAADEAGEEYLLDVSFKEVNLDENLLLKAVSQNANDRRENAGRAFGDLVEWMRSGTASGTA